MVKTSREQFANQEALMAFMRYHNIEDKLNYSKISTDVTLNKAGTKKTYRYIDVSLDTNESYDSWGQVIIDWDAHYVGYKCDGIFSLEFDITSNNELSIKSPDGWEVIIHPFI